MFSWYLACHKHGKSNLLKAQVALEFMGVTSFTPLLCTRKTRSDRSGQYRAKMESLFPGYFFININPEKHKIKEIESTPGFSHLVRVGVEIKPIRHEIIDKIMSLPFCEIDQEKKDVEKENCVDERLLEITKVESVEERNSRLYEFVSSHC